MAFYNERDNLENFNLFSDGEDAKDLYGLFARSYFQAAMTLAETLLAKENGFRQYEAYPVVFLYRHSFELHLKNIIFKSDLLAAFKGLKDMPNGERHGHNIGKLSELAASILRKLFPEDDSLEAVTLDMLRISAEFQEMTPASDWYRYPETNAPKKKKDGKKNPEEEDRPKPRLANLGSFHGTLKGLMGALGNIDLGIDVTRDSAELDWEWENAPDETAREDLRREYPWKFGSDPSGDSETPTA